MKQVDRSPKKPLLFYYVIALLVLMLLNALVFPALLANQVTEVSYDKFLTMIEQKQVKQVALETDTILFTTQEEGAQQPSYYKTGRVQDDDLVNRLKDSGAAFSAVIPTQD